MTKKNYKFDIFELFDKINHENYVYIDNLKEEQLKEISPYVVQRWMIGALDNNEIHTILTNQYMNMYTFNLQNHKVLLLKLACLANGEIDNTRYKFIKPVQSKRDNKELQPIMEYYNCSPEQAEELYSILDNDDLKELRDMYE